MSKSTKFLRWSMSEVYKSRAFVGEAAEHDGYPE
jgi:hypothetical protein